ncbi:ATP-dependent nuclease [Desulfoferrobacter suflitae]|uniref:ATP-dependent nuclease n=1 Tax=Desulfoferrobacter suflitae TaxID=2865782 RepID=UPI0021641615|nr:AAA family ATPase [Desulfoferrobacter suflitae]MCK8600140.1 AAA family ATPase [Desulfoferrobacter suflitae]
MRICQVEFRNFRGIREGCVVLPRHGVLLGANNAGKTTVVEALAFLFGRERMVSPISDWDFFEGAPRPDSRFFIIATLTDFGSNDPTAVPDWFIGQEAAQPVWWHEKSKTLSTELDPPEGAVLAAQVAMAGRFDDEACEFETIRYFYHGECDPFTDGCSMVPWRLLRQVGLFLLSSNRDWDKLLSFRSSSLLKLIREYDALPGRAVDVLKKQLRTDVAKIEESSPLSDILEAATRELQSFLLIGQSSKMVYRPTTLDAHAVLQSLVAHVAGQGDVLIPVAKHGAGMVSLQAFLLLLAFAEHRRESGQNFILAAEEPELHLHPSLHQRLVHRIRSASVQSIVTTQSPNVAAGYQPQEVIFVTNANGKMTADRLRTEPVSNIRRNSVRNLYLVNRAAFYEAIMGCVVLVPEGQYDYEWLSLWQRLAQSYRDSMKSFDLRPTSMLPTSDAAVAETFREIARFRQDAVPVIDGDSPGDSYLADLVAGSPAPGKIIRYGDRAAVECLSAWILEPALSSPREGMKSLLGGSRATLRNLQNAILARKKDREMRETIVWECLATDGCCERACELLHDLAAIASNGAPSNAGWHSHSEPNGTVVHVASHVRRV